MSWLFEIDTQEYYAYWDNLFTKEECKKIIDIANNKEKLIAKISNGELDLNTRNNLIVWLNHQDNIDWVYKHLTHAVTSLNERFFKFDLTGFIEDLQFTEYNAPDNFYEEHVDKGQGHLARKLSISIQLTDPNQYDGGNLELLYKKDPEIAKRQQGSLTMFPSYTLHRVTPVTRGTRHSLVAWINGPAFK